MLFPFLKQEKRLKKQIMSNTYSVLPVITDSDHDRASALVYKKYQQSNYIKEGENLSIQQYLKKESSITFGAYACGVMYGTVSLVFDNPEGLPLETIFKDEVTSLRQEGKKLAEAVQFAVDQDICKQVLPPHEVFFATLPLFARIIQEAKNREVDTLLISVNPKHVSFYEKVGFTIFGEEKHYGAVSAPAIAMSLSLATLTTPLFQESMIGKKILEYTLTYA